MILEPLRPGLIAQVAYNMRARDREELAALGMVVLHGAESFLGGADTTSFTTTTTQLAERLARARYGFVACADDGSPVAVCAGEENLPGLVGWNFFATARLPEIGLALTRHIRRSFIPILREAGVRRAEARSLKGYDWAARWMRSLGFRDLCVLKRFGAGGQDFILWELIDDDVWKLSISSSSSATAAAAGHRQRGRARD